MVDDSLLTSYRRPHRHDGHRRPHQTPPVRAQRPPTLLPPNANNSQPPPNNRIPKILKISLVVFIIFSILGMIHRRFFRLTKEQRRTLRQARRNAFHRRRSQCRARIQERKERFRTATRGFFRRLFRLRLDDEEKEAMLVEQRRRHVESEVASTNDTSIEDEIASLREAAEVVGEMVAAEEGRLTRHHVEMTIQEPERVEPPAPVVYLAPCPPVPVMPRLSGTFAEFMGSDEALPAYEAGDSDSSVVADGFRYTPGSTEYSPTQYTPSGSSESGASTSDALGDTKH